MMILAGDIGATHSRVAAFQAEGNKFPLVVEKIYESQQYSNLAQIAGPPPGLLIGVAQTKVVAAAVAR